MIRIIKDLIQRIQALLNNPQSDVTLSEQKNVEISSPVAENVVGSRLICIGGHNTGQVIPLLRSRFTIGRDPTLCDLAVTQDTLLSRNHTALFYENEQWFCADLGSTNGTFVDNYRVTQAALPILPGVTIQPNLGL